MKKNSIVKVSKRLSYLLRHNPQALKLDMDTNGWVPVSQLISSGEFTMDSIEKAVKENNKKRFEFSSDKKKIRARQGHSIEIDLGYKPVKPLDLLYHGTATKSLKFIWKDGLKKMNRHAVHLSKDIITAENVGKRHGKVIVLMIDAKKMHENGHEFFLTENGVWFTDNVPFEYIRYQAFPSSI